MEGTGELREEFEAGGVRASKAVGALVNLLVIPVRRRGEEGRQKQCRGATRGSSNEFYQLVGGDLLGFMPNRLELMCHPKVFLGRLEKRMKEGLS